MPEDENMPPLLEEISPRSKSENNVNDANLTPRGMWSVHKLREALAKEHRLKKTYAFDYDDDDCRSDYSDAANSINSSGSESGQISPRAHNAGERIVDSRRPWLDQLRAHFSETNTWMKRSFAEGTAFFAAYMSVLIWYARQSDHEALKQTPTWEPIIVTIIYSLIIYVGSRLMRHRPTPCGRRISEYMISYNVFQLLLSCATAVLLLREVFRLDFWLYGNKVDSSHNWLSFLIWSHYHNQILQMLDTVFLVCRKKFGALSLLHVWLRLASMWSWYWVVRFGLGGDSYFPALVQTTTRIPVYVFYVSSLLRNGEWHSSYWKERITKLQLGTFVLLIFYSMAVFVTGSIHRFVNAVFLATLLQSLLLFTNFHFETTQAKSNRMSDTIDVPARVVFSFDSSGWLFFYHFGVGLYIKHVLMPKMRPGSVAFSGASGGACVSAGLVSRKTKLLELKNFVKSSRHRVIPKVWEAFTVCDEAMEQYLPEDCAKDATDDFRVIMTRVMLKPPFVCGEIVDRYDDKEHMSAIIRASSHIPFLGGILPYKFRGSYYLDGFWWASEHFIPWRSFRPDDFVVRVSAMGTPNSWISPKLWLPPWWALIPPQEEVLEGLCACGFEDAENFFGVMGGDDTEEYKQLRAKLVQGKERDFLYAAHSSWRNCMIFVFIMTGLVAMVLERLISFTSIIV